MTKMWKKVRTWRAAYRYADERCNCTVRERGGRHTPYKVIIERIING